MSHVNVPATSGDMGIYANHVPSIVQLKPGMIEVVPLTGPSKKIFSKTKKELLVTIHHYVASAQK